MTEELTIRVVDDSDPENPLLDKIDCIRWAKSKGFDLPDLFWQQLKEHDEKESKR